MQLRYSRHFQKAFRKLPADVRAQFRERLTLFVREPQHPQLHVHKLSGEYRHCWSFNVNGDHRAVFERVDPQTILLVAIGTHSQLYSE